MMTRSERDKMLGGELYRASDPDLVAARARCRSLLRRYNVEADTSERESILRELLGKVGEGVAIESPFACDYGSNIYVGESVFVNFNTVILDCADVVIGDATQIASAVQIVAADHPRDAPTRRTGLELARPISIGANVWIGSAAVVCPGVSIGDNSVIGAGSVVTRDVPAGVVAIGNPCRVLREL
jgi:maltose O-acetyltransferase